MTRTYVFGCHEQIEKLNTLTVNVRVKSITADSKGPAFQKANELALAHGLAAPKLIFETGIPDIRVVIEGGKVTSVFYRNSECVPVVSVVDLDYCGNKPVSSLREYEAACLESGNELMMELEAGGFQLVPHFEQS